MHSTDNTISTENQQLRLVHKQPIYSLEIIIFISELFSVSDWLVYEFTVSFYFCANLSYGPNSFNNLPLWWIIISPH